MMSIWEHGGNIENTNLRLDNYRYYAKTESSNCFIMHTDFLSCTCKDKCTHEKVIKVQQSTWK